jgi:hypothetical protein
MTDETRGFWKSLFTGPNVVATGLFLVSLGMWIGDQYSFHAQIEQRVSHLEAAVAQMAADGTESKTNRAVVSLQLSQIQYDITSLRGEVKDVKTEVRKIR